MSGKGNRQWTTVEYGGPFIYPPYKPLPDYVKLKYGDMRVTLSPEAEEVATFYANVCNGNGQRDQTFVNNFFRDWKNKMNEKEKSLIKCLWNCDFTEIKRYLKENKNSLKKLNNESKAEYNCVTVDGVKQEIGNFRVEAPGLFLSVNNEKRGKVKKRIQHKDVTINCSSYNNNSVPQSAWQATFNDPSVKWIARWEDELSNKYKYISIKCDIEKFETAQNLETQIQVIQDDYNNNLEDNDEKMRQRGLALYFIDKFGFRAGNETDNSDSEAVGCCSLQVKHVILKNEIEFKIQFNFKGKCSIPYFKETEVSRVAYETIRNNIKVKSPEDKLFDKVSPKIINDYLKTKSKDCTIKVFRTHHASEIMETELLSIDKNKSEKEKIRECEKAFYTVAKFLNHKKFKKNVYEINTAGSERYYVDPRILVAWCLNNDIPIKSIYSTEEQLKIHQWAINANDNNFKYKNPIKVEECKKEEEK